jgi:hypothetical protein
MQEECPKLTVGQEVFVKTPSRTVACYRVKVEKVGRRWVHFSSGWRAEIGSRQIDGQDYSSPGRIYISEEEYRTELARDMAWTEFRELMNRRWRAPAGTTSARIYEAIDLLGLRVSP